MPLQYTKRYCAVNCNYVSRLTCNNIQQCRVWSLCEVLQHIHTVPTCEAERGRNGLHMKKQCLRGHATCKESQFPPESDPSGILLISFWHSFLNANAKLGTFIYTDDYQDYGPVYMLGSNLTLSCLSLVYQVLYVAIQFLYPLHANYVLQ